MLTRVSAHDAAIENFEALFAVMGEDVEHALRALDAEPSARNRRTVFRTVFACIEAVTQCLKQQVLALWPNQRAHYSDAEVAMLREETYDLDARADAKTRIKVLPPDLNFRFAIHMFMRGVPAAPLFDASSDGWRCLRESLRVRNRVTHPRVASNIEVSQEEIERLRVAYAFVRGTTVSNIAHALLALRHAKYRLLGRVLSPEALAWIDALPMDKDGIQSPVAVPARLIAGLLAADLIDNGPSGAQLNFYGREFANWRRMPTTEQM